jgi:RimJ/RimL family protein N-acetyltransferase
MKQPALESARLILRTFQLSDVDQVVELANNWEVARTTRNIPYPYLKEHAVEWITGHKDFLEQGTRLTYAITKSEEQSVIGAIGLINLNEYEGSLGYWVGEPYWGNGYCTEAAGCLMQYAFKELQLKRIYAEHMEGNIASGRVMQNNGMKKIGTNTMIGRNSEQLSVDCYEIKLGVEADE